jgi:transposase
MKGETMYNDIQSYGKKLSIRKVAETLDIAPNTVQKYLNMNMEEALTYFKDRKRKSQFDQEFEYIIERIKQYPKISGTKLHREVTDRNSEITAGKRAFRNYIRPIKKMYKDNKIRNYEPVIDDKPGQQVQVDIGEIQAECSEVDKDNFKVYFVAFVHSYSRHMFVYYQNRPFTTQDFIKAHIESFKYFGVIAEEFVYDQTKLVVINEKYGEIVYNDKFNQFAMQMGFQSNICEGYDPESKGKVERSIRYIKENFFYGSQFKNLDDVRNSGKHWLESVANVRVHSTTGEQPIEMFKEEQIVLSERNSYYQHFTSENTRDVDKEGLLHYAGNKYSAPMKYQRKEVGIKEVNKILEIYKIPENKKIAEHKIPASKGNIIKNNNHYRDYEQELKDKIKLAKSRFSNFENGIELIDRIKDDNPKIARMQIRGLLKLRKKFSDKVWNKAFEILEFIPQVKYSTIEKVLEKKKRKLKLESIINKNYKNNQFNIDNRDVSSSSLDRPLSKYMEEVVK